MAVNKVQTKNIVFGDNAIPFIGGPCVIESRDHCFGMAEQITEVVSKLNVPFIFKSSFDKANRTSISSYRGNGIEDGLKILEEIKIILIFLLLQTFIFQSMQTKCVML